MKCQSILSSAINERENENIKSELTFIGIKESQLEKYEKVQKMIYMLL